MPGVIMCTIYSVVKVAWGFRHFLLLKLYGPAI